MAEVLEKQKYWHVVKAEIKWEHFVTTNANRGILSTKIISYDASPQVMQVMAEVLEKLLILNMVVAAERSRLDYVILAAVKVIGEKGWFAGEQPKATIESLMKGNFCAQEEK